MWLGRTDGQTKSDREIDKFSFLVEPPFGMIVTLAYRAYHSRADTPRLS